MSARIFTAVLILFAAPAAVAQLGPPTSPTLPGGTPTITPPDRTPAGTLPTLRDPVQIRGPLAPRIESIAAVALLTPESGAPPAPLQNALLRVALGNLGGAESFEIASVQSDCGWAEPPSLVHPRLHRASEPGFGSFTRQGVFRRSSSGGCTVRVTVSMKRAGLAPEPPITLTSAPVALLGGREVTILVTGEIATRLGFSNSTSIGVCRGASVGTLPGSKTHTVGVNTQSDIRISVRSGPLGTYCDWRTAPLELPPGVELIEMVSRATASDATANSDSGSRAGTCGVDGHGEQIGSKIHARHGPRPPYVLDRGTLPLPLGWYRLTMPWGTPLTRSGYPPLLTDDGVILVSDSGVRSLFRTVLPPLRVVLGCGPTATNDHYAELTIERLKFFVPDNVQFP